MQLKLTTNYAIRILLCLLIQKNNGNISSSELGDMLDISSNYILKIMRTLSKEKMVLVEVGKYGGFRINLSREPIRLYDVIAIMEPTMKINNCLESVPKLQNSFEENYNIKAYWLKVQKKMDKTLSITLEELIDTCRLRGKEERLRQWKENM